MEKDLLTIQQFAKAAGKSRQAIYQQLHTSLKAYVTEQNGQRFVDKKALSEVYGIGSEAVKAVKSMTDVNDNVNDNRVDSRHNKKNTEADSELVKALYSQVDAFKAVNDSLKEQLIVKDKQIESLNATIDKLTANMTQLTVTLSQQQTLHMQTLKQIEEKQNEAEPIGADQEEPKKKKSFFGVFKKKEK